MKRKFANHYLLKILGLRLLLALLVLMFLPLGSTFLDLDNGVILAQSGGEGDDDDDPPYTCPDGSKTADPAHCPSVLPLPPPTEEDYCTILPGPFVFAGEPLVDLESPRVGLEQPNLEDNRGNEPTFSITSLDSNILGGAVTTLNFTNVSNEVGQVNFNLCNAAMTINVPRRTDGNDTLTVRTQILLDQTALNQIPGVNPSTALIFELDVFDTSVSPAVEISSHNPPLEAFVSIPPGVDPGAFRVFRINDSGQVEEITPTRIISADDPINRTGRPLLAFNIHATSIFVLGTIAGDGTGSFVAPETVIPAGLPRTGAASLPILGLVIVGLGVVTGFGVWRWRK